MYETEKSDKKVIKCKPLISNILQLSLPILYYSHHVQSLSLEDCLFVLDVL